MSLKSLSGESGARQEPECGHGYPLYLEEPSGLVVLLRAVCRVVSCDVGRANRRRQAVARILAGMVGAPPGDLWELVLTAPGMDLIADAEALVEWNRGVGKRWHALRRGLLYHLPDLQYVRVYEVQKRGAIHLHIVVRSSFRVSTRQVRKLAAAAGFGRSRWALVRSTERLAVYYAKYLTKGGVRFPLGTRVLDASRGWELTPYVRPLRDGVVYAGPVAGRSWSAWAEQQDRAEPAWFAEVRRNRRTRSLTVFEDVVREQYAAWLRTPRGVAARLRQGDSG